MGVLCEWPGEAPAPWRFAFLTGETRPPACSEEALRVEQAARRREELNALYVAMTRAEDRIVLSSIEPHRRTEATWWERLRPLAAPLEAPPAVEASGAETEAPIELKALPRLGLTTFAPPDGGGAPITREVPASDPPRVAVELVPR